ncbi:MAG: amidohydrolase family protein [Gemmatimonadales bacterium]|jgi:imidazolonepropionase-like amidohydrolase
MKKLGTLVSVIALVTGLLASPAMAQWDVQIERGAIDVPRGTLVIQNLDAVWTASGQVLENVSIVVRDGIIREIGTDVSIPRDAELIDGAGLTAIPGIIDDHAHTAQDRAVNEGTTPVSAEVRVMDALDPTSYDIYRALSGGVTTSLILHGSANPIGGQAAIIKMRWGMDDPEQLLFEGAPLMIKFALGENVTGKNWNPEGRARFPRSRAGVESFYDQIFSAALEYKQAWDRYNADRRAYPVPPRRDLRLETVARVLDGRILVRAHSYRSDEIVMLMRVAERYGFRIDNFTHVLEGYKVADELAEHGASAGTFSDWWAYKLEAYDAIPHNAAIMHEHGVLTTLNSDGPLIQPFMVYEFNKPVKYGGVSREDALRMLTLHAAQSLHIDDRVGSIEVGKEADIVLLNGDPFNTYSRVEKTIVDGIVYFDLSREAETRGAPIRALPEVSPPPVTAAPTTAMAGSAATDGSDRAEATLALVGATVHPVSGPEIADAVVMISDDRIGFVGPRARADIPAGAEVISVAGKHIYPGMIDPITRIGMIEVGQVAASRDDQETGRYSPHVNALWGVHPHSAEVNVTRANGITAVLSVPGSGVIWGAGAVIQLSGDTPERMAIAERAAIVIDFPSPSGKDWEDPKLEGERLEELVDLFERAVAYAAVPSHNDDPTAPFDGNDRMRERAMLEAMLPAVTGQMPVFFAAASERDIKTLFLFLDKFPEVDAVLVGADQAFRVADELAERGIPVIIASALSRTNDRAEPVSANYANAGILHAAGVKIAFGTGDYANVRNLPYHAAKAVAFGLPQEVGLRAVTLNTAEILGLGSELGSIEVGKRADLIVTDGDPLQIVTNVERAFINGLEVSLEDNKHTRLFEQFKDRH